MPSRPFHLAIPVHDLDAARDFYGGLFGCREGRSSPSWIDYDFFGHQLTVHLAPREARLPRTNAVDGDEVPVRHFGAVLGWDEWQEWAKALEQRGVNFVIAPRVRFQGEVGEQATMFLRDPSGNAIELKAFQNPDSLFARPEGEAGPTLRLKDDPRRTDSAGPGFDPFA